LHASTDPTRFWGRTSALGLAACVLCGPGVAAQAIFNQFSAESLAPRAVGFDLGALGGTHIGGANLVALRLDVGPVAPRVRVVLGLSYFHANLTNAELSQFAARLRSLVIDPTGDDTIELGQVSWGDLTGDLDFKYLVPEGNGVRLYVGAGASVHIRHGSGPAIDGTFVQDALDAITPGLNGLVGAEFGTGQWRLVLEGRGVLASELSTVAMSCGVRYAWVRSR
jgi:hypothetical protein